MTIRRSTPAVSGPGIGSASLIMLFVVLCLTVFAALTIVSVRAELTLSRRYAQSTEAYYAADARATEAAAKIYAAADRVSAAISLGCEVTAEESGVAAVYETEIDANRILRVEIFIGESGAVEIRSWKPVVSNSWQTGEYNLFT